MNKKINYIIETYLENQNKTDYAIMINGKWGCGKTYYVANELRKLIEKKDIQYIYISLNGCNNFSRIINKITLRLLFKSKSASIDDDLIDNLYGLGAGLSEFNTKTKIFYEIFTSLKNVITKPITEKLISEINPSKIVIIFDDIERVSSDTLRNDFLGLIYENYSKKGYKTIIVGDETNIIDENYNKVKEKVIRRIISYEPDKKQQIESFIDNQFAYSKYKSYLDKNKDKLINYITISKVINLRTISFIIDNFLFVFDKLNDEMKIKFSDFIFKNILLLTNEYKKGNLNNINNINHLTNFPDGYYIDVALRKRGTEIKRTYLDDLHDRYLTNPIFDDYKFIKELLNFILTGYLNIDKLENEIKSLFYDEYMPESEKAINFLTHNLADLEEKELITGFDNFICHLEKGEYNIYRLPYIYSFLKFIEKKCFIASWHYDIEKTINIALAEAVKNKNMVYDETAHFTRGQKYSEIEFNEDFYNKLLEEIEKQTNNKKAETKKEKIEKTFQLIISKNREYYDQLYSNYEFFQDIVETKSEHLLFSLPNKGISTLVSYLYSNILKISNAGLSISYKEKPALEKIITYLESNIDSYSKEHNHLRIVHLKELIDSMKDAVVHLEKTHNN